MSMPRIWAALAVLTLVAGCGGGTEDADNATVLVGTGFPLTDGNGIDGAPATIADGFLGSWDRDAAACAAAPGEMRLTVGPDALRFYEAGARVEKVTPTPTGAADVDVIASSEGMTEARRYRLSIDDAGKLIVMGGGVTTTRVKCAAATPAAAVATRGEGLLNLAPDGLSIVSGDTGSSRALAFGIAKAAVEGVLDRAAGKPVDKGVNEECGEGPLVYRRYASGLTTYYQLDRFVGWAVNRPGSTLTTASGIGIGSTRKALDAAYDARVEETTLGQEFGAGDLSGILDGKGPDAKITALWAGMSCNFR